MDIPVELVCAIAQHEQVDPSLVLAIISVEVGDGKKKSDVRPDGSVDYGLMQVRDQTLAKMSEPWCRMPPELLMYDEFGVTVGCKILKYEMRMAGGDLELALARYTGGEMMYFYQPDYPSPVPEYIALVLERRDKFEEELNEE